MSFSNFSKKNYQEHKLMLIALLVVFIACLVLLVNYNWFTMNVGSGFSNLVGYIINRYADYYNLNLSYLYEHRLLEYEGITHRLVVPEGALLPYLLIFVFLLSYNIYKPLHSVLIILLSIIFLIIRSFIITLIFAVGLESHPTLVLLLIDTMIYYPLVLIVFYLTHYTPAFIRFYSSFKRIYQNQFAGSPFLLIAFLLILPSLPRVIPAYISPDFIPSIIHSTIQHTAALINLFTDYSPRAYGKYLFLESNWISLEHPCLGTSVVVIILILIAFTKSDFLNKLTFSVVFVLGFHVLNTIRLAGLLVYIYENPELLQSGRAFLHNTITYVMYFFALVSFYLYHYWYSQKKLYQPNVHT